MDLDALEQAVIKELIAFHDVDDEEAEELASTSRLDQPDYWNENTIPSNLAAFLASDENV
jgi:hypothetical protein